MNYLQSPPPDASAFLRGLVSLGIQTFLGQKTVRLATAANGERALTVGTSVADASVNEGFTLLSARTGIGGTEKELLRVRRPSTIGMGVLEIDGQGITNTYQLRLFGAGSGLSGIQMNSGVGFGQLVLSQQQSGSPALIYAENKGLHLSQNANAYDTATLMKFEVASPANVATSVPAFDFRTFNALGSGQKLARWQVNGADVAHVRGSGAFVLGANTANPIGIGFAADLANVADGFKYNVAASELGVFSSNNSAFIGLNLGTGNARASGGFTIGGNFESSLTAGGLILKSPDGTRWKLTITNAGATSVALA